MKNSDITIDEIKNALRKINNKSDKKTILFVIIGITLVTVSIIYAIVKLKNKNNDYEEIEEDEDNDDEEVREDYTVLDYEDEE